MQDEKELVDPKEFIAKGSDGEMYGGTKYCILATTHVDNGHKIKKIIGDKYILNTGEVVSEHLGNSLIIKSSGVSLTELE